jgi:hypothetical protein
MGFCAQLGAMTKKNWVQKKVNIWRTVLEFIWPVIYGLIIGITMAYSNLSPQSKIDITAYIPFWLIILIFSPLVFTQGVIFILN